MPKTKVSKTVSTVKDRDGSSRTVEQYKTTVPKAIAEAMRLGSATIEWEVKGADAIRVEVVEREEDE